MIGYYQYLPQVMKAVGGEGEGDLHNKDLTFANDTASLSSANNRNNFPAGHWWCTGNCNFEHWDEFGHHCREYAVGAEGEEIEGYFATPRAAGDNNNDNDDDSYYAAYAKANKGKSWECKMSCNRTHTFGSDECPRWEIGNDGKEKDKKSNPQRKF
jgi:hypothetical protein